MIPLAVIGSAVIGVVLFIFVNRKTHVNPYIVIVNCDTHQSGQEAELFLRSNTDRCVVKKQIRSERRGGTQYGNPAEEG